jgi:ABC-type nickel/cobalt efflux system permease component RcnA
MEEHPRFQFELDRAFGELTNGTHRLQLEDTSFFLEKGQIRIAIRTAEPCVLQSSSVAAHLEDVAIKSDWEMSPEQQDAARRATAEWITSTAMPRDAVVPTLEAKFPVSGATASPPDATQDLTGLLDRWSAEFSVFLLGLAFFFGAAHAMTPGHGKTMVAAYLVGERGTLWHAVSLGLTTALTHTSSVLAIALLLRLSGRELQDKLSMGFALASGVLVAVLGGCLFVGRLRAQMRRERSRLAHVSAGDGVAARGMGCQSAGGPRLPGLVTLGISGGLVPCPDAIVLLLIATAKGQIDSAVYLLLSFSAGLAGSLVLVGILAVKLRGFLAGRIGSGRFVQLLPLASAAAILLVGLYLCFTTVDGAAGFRSLMAGAANRTAGS